MATVKAIEKKIKELQSMLMTPQDELEHLYVVRLLAGLDEAERKLKRQPNLDLVTKNNIK